MNKPIVPQWAEYFTAHKSHTGSGVHIEFYTLEAIQDDDSQVFYTIESLNELMSGNPQTQPLSKYHREIKPGVFVDVYAVLGAFTAKVPARIKPQIDHLLKKLLAPGERGHKTIEQDLKDVSDSALNALETLKTWGNK